MESQNDFKFYRLSGEIGISALFWGPLYGVIAAIPLSFVYAYAVRYIPFIYLNFIISFFYVFLICIAYKVGEDKGNNRNRGFSFLGATLMGLLCLYIAWATFLFVLLKHEINYFKLLVNPPLLWELIQALVERGWFSIGSSKELVSGTFYAVLLGIEAVGYVVIFQWLGTLEREKVYCENCSAWINPVVLPYPISSKLSGDILQTAQTGHIPWIQKLELENPATPSCIMLSQSCCDTCAQLKLLSAKKIEMVETKDGSEKKETLLFQNLILSKREHEELKKKLEELAMAQAPEVTPENRA